MFLATSLSTAAAKAQEYYPEENDAQETAASAPSLHDNDAYSTQQLDQLLAPIALYPDALLNLTLAATTQPLQLVEASRWLARNSSLTGNSLTNAITEQPWDTSVKALLAFPQVLQTLNANINWTQQVGAAFMAEQPAVMDSVQRLRRQALDTGTLVSTPQQTVEDQSGTIVIAPATPDTVYVPYYDTTMAYGSSPYPNYAPYYFSPPDGYYYQEGMVDFGPGYVTGPFWNGGNWDQHRHWDRQNQRYGNTNYKGYELQNAPRLPQLPHHTTGSMYSAAAHPATPYIAPPVIQPSTPHFQTRPYNIHDMASPPQASRPAPPASSGPARGSPIVGR